MKAAVCSHHKALRERKAVLIYLLLLLASKNLV